VLKSRGSGSRPGAASAPHGRTKALGGRGPRSARALARPLSRPEASDAALDDRPRWPLVTRTVRLHRGGTKSPVTIGDRNTARVVVENDIANLRVAVLELANAAPATSADIWRRPVSMSFTRRTRASMRRRRRASSGLCCCARRTASMRSAARSWLWCLGSIRGPARATLAGMRPRDTDVAAHDERARRALFRLLLGEDLARALWPSEASVAP
jgi:hypothetical protein